MSDLGSRIATRLLESDYDTWAPILMPDGSARQAQWTAEDGWLVVYTTAPVDRGRWAGKFVTMAYRPEGPGSRTGNATRWRRVYARAYSTRRLAKARALVLYRQHSPRWAGRHP